MIKQSVTIINKLGLHARAAAKFAKLANEFESDVRLVTNGRTVNGKSIMGILMLAASHGTQLELEIDGPDAQDAYDKLTGLINAKFDEDE